MYLCNKRARREPIATSLIWPTSLPTILQTATCIIVGYMIMRHWYHHTIKHDKSTNAERTSKALEAVTVDLDAYNTSQEIKLRKYM